MSSDFTDPRFAGSTDGQATNGESEADARCRAVEDIVGDEAMPVAERQARLEALASEWNLPPDPDVEETVADPTRVQIARALALLADGGHKTT